MAYFIPSYYKEKLLRYLLSHSGVIDTETIDLDHLDIVWGKRSTVELRDVRLDIKKIAHLLHLPETVQPTKACILLLRLTIPADIHQSGIVVEVNGIEINVRLTDKSAGNSKSKPDEATDRDSSRQGHASSESANEDGQLPTARELAQSFLAEEPPEEREDLKVALQTASGQQVDDDAWSEASDDEPAIGMGTGLSVPGFLTSFIKGIVDRIEMSIANVTLAIDADLLLDEAISTSLTTVSVQLGIRSVGIEGLTTVTTTSDPKAGANTEPEGTRVARIDKRRVRLRDISCLFVSEAALFANLQKISRAASPVSTRASSSMHQSSEGGSVGGQSSLHSTRSPQRSRSDVMSSSVHSAIRPDHNSFLESELGMSARNFQGNEERMTRSVLSEDRFADADDEEEEDDAHFLTSSHLRRASPSQPFHDPYGNDLFEEGLPFAMDDSQVSEAHSIDERQQYASPSASMLLDNVKFDPYDYTRPPFPIPKEHRSLDLAATAPLAQRPLNTFSNPSDPHRPYNSELFPATDRKLTQDHHLDVPFRAITPNLSSPVGSISSGGSSDSQSRSGDEDLSESKIFSHEEAESMYMSAMSEMSSQKSGMYNMPGGWGRGSVSSKGSVPEQPPVTTLTTQVPPSISEERENAGFETPRPSSPVSPSIGEPQSMASVAQQTFPSHTLEREAQVASPASSGEQRFSEESGYRSPTASKRLLTVDEISLWLPWAGAEKEKVQFAEPEKPVPAYHDDLAYGDMPGAFSQYSSSIRGGKGRRSSSPHPKFASDVTIDDSMATLPDQAQEPASKDSMDLEVEIGNVRSQVDLSTGRLLFQIVQQFLDAWVGQPGYEEPSPPTNNLAPVNAAEGIETSQKFSVKVQEFTLALLESLPIVPTISSPSPVGPSADNEHLFQVKVASVEMSAQIRQSLTNANFDIGTFEFGSPDEIIISFDNASRKPTSQRGRDGNVKNDISITYDAENVLRGPEVHMRMLPLLIALNMHKLDDRLAGFGGVSGVLDMSSSIASNNTILAASPNPKLGGKTVRFDAPPTGASENVLSPIKLNAKIDGLTFKLQGKACGVLLQNNAMKLIVRKDRASVAIDQIRLTGPFHTHQQSQPGLVVNVSKTRFDFLLKPHEDDLDKLVSLITPSRDKYEDDDDILLDTLLRQRQKGSLLRVTIAQIQASVDDIENAKRLQLLSYEISKLSSVAKYLPEDDRPGLLTLASVGTIQAHANINESIGMVRATCHKFCIAHVGLPSLLALEMGAINVTRNTDDEIVGVLLELQPEDQLPMIMARIIGDELEPTIKVKLFNMIVEYRVPTLMAVLGLAGAESVESLAASMVASVATVRLDSSRSGIVRQDSAATSTSNRSSVSPFHVDLLLRDCAIGLNPDKSPSKGLFLLTNALLKANTSVKESFSTSLEIRKASILLIDDTENWDTSVQPAMRPRSSEAASPTVSDFCREGWQSVATVSVAKVIVHVTEDINGESLVNVTLSNELFFMESCADSTQTLIAVLNGLKPPMPPSKEQRYRTNVAPIQDMMASFSGEAYSQPDPEENVGDALDMDMDDVDDILDDLPSNLDFVGSFYDPEAGFDYEEPLHSPIGAASQTSLRSTASRRMDKTTSFADGIEEQFEYGPSNARLDLSEDYLDFFNAKSAVRKWNKKTSKFENIYQAEIKTCPVRVQVTVGNIIWHLYDGYDWAKTREVISRAVDDVEARAEERRRNRQISHLDDDAESEIGDLLFQSIWIAIPPNREDVDLRKQINRGIDDVSSETHTVTTSVNSRDTSRPTHRRRKSKTLRLDRSKSHRITFEMREVAADFLVLGPGFGETQSSLALRVNNFEIFDHVITSTWKKFLTYQYEAGERQKDQPMIRLDLLTVKPMADLATSELIIKVSLLPIRLHVDQDALDFVTRFFEFKSQNEGDEERPDETGEQPFIQRIEVNTVPVKLDYKPKKVNYSGLRSGHTSEFANFFILDGAEFKLQHLIYYGVQSPDKLQKILKDIWTDDVIMNQLPTVLSGLSAVRPLVDVGSGVRDLVMIPMREYKKDGRLVRSIQKGATSFARTTTSELARLGAKVAIGTQTILEGAEGLLSPSSASPRSAGYASRRRSGADEWDDDDFSTSPAREEPRAISNYADQPLNVVTGFRDAWTSLGRDLVTARDAIIAIGGEVRDSESAMGAAGAVVRRAPTIILRPAIGGTKAVGIALLGGANALDKGSRRKIEDKYKRYG